MPESNLYIWSHRPSEMPSSSIHLLHKPLLAALPPRKWAFVCREKCQCQSQKSRQQLSLPGQYFFLLPGQASHRLDVSWITWRCFFKYRPLACGTPLINCGPKFPSICRWNCWKWLHVKRETHFSDWDDFASIDKHNEALARHCRALT